MGDALFADPRLYDYLLWLDRDLCKRARHAGCPQCAGVLHSATYQRKPRGLPPGLTDAVHTRRLSLCCARCRQRVTPPSVRFLGRRVYTGAVLVLACVRTLTAARIRELQALLGVDRRTLRRWCRWWRESLVASPWWRVARARFLPPLEEQHLPGALLARFEEPDPLRRMAEVLAFLAPFSVAAGHVG